MKITYIERIYDPTADFRQKQNEFIDEFTKVYQTSNYHIKAVLNNGKFLILDY